MRSPSRSRPAAARSLAAAMAVTVAAACGGGGDDDAAPAPTTSTSQAASTTTAPPVPAGTAPLTALPADPARLDRPALVVKIDNAPLARPQAGINEADVVVEEGVEGGVTRFAAVFHSRDADPVGPVRSARSTDIAVSRPLGHPLFAYSGANAVFAELLGESPLVDVGVGRAPGAYRRERGRPAPYNLFSATPPLFSAAGAAGTPPEPLFAYRDPESPGGAGAAPAGAEPAPRVQAQWRGRIITTVVYEWDGAAGGFARTQDGTPHVDAAGVRVAPANVVLQAVHYRDTGLVDRSGAAVPEAELVGEGEAWILTAGRLVRGRWVRGADDPRTRYTDAAGAPVRLTPGRTWVELVPVGNLSAG